MLLLIALKFDESILNKSENATLLLLVKMA